MNSSTVRDAWMGIRRLQQPPKLFGSQKAGGAEAQRVYNEEFFSASVQKNAEVFAFDEKSGLVWCE